MVSCSELGINNSLENKNYKELYRKICVQGSGKGRLEFLSNKYPFSYETEIDFKKNNFNLALDFPIVGEQVITLSLNPREMAKTISHTKLVSILEDQIGQRQDKEEIIQGVEEFFVLTSEFVQLRIADKLPDVYNVKVLNQHFVIERIHSNFVFEIDAFIDNSKYFDRTIFKISKKNSATIAPILSLYLLPDACGSR